MSLKKLIIEEVSDNNIEIIAYHGTNMEYDEDDKIFVSLSKNFADDYGYTIFQISFTPEKIFDSTSLRDIKLLYDNGFKLTDEYIDRDPFGSEWLLEKGLYYFDEESGTGYYPTAEKFIEAINHLGNTWEPIEMTQGVIDFIEGKGYDCIYLIEDGIENYFILEPEIINGVKEI